MKSFALALCACLGACAVDVPFEQYCQKFTDMGCNAADSCNCLDVTTRGLCPTYLMMQCQDGVEKDVKAGKKTYDPHAAGQCLHDLGNILGDCQLTNDDYPEACDHFLVGAVAAGGACDGSSQCQPGMSCRSSTCVVMPTDGQACLDYSCADGLYCGDQVCHTKKGAGGSCADTSAACGDNLFCDGNDQICKGRLSAGGDCSGNSGGCGDNLYCSTLAKQTCQSYPGSGGDCTDSYGSCADGYYCDTTKHCVAKLGEGQSCTESSQCQSDKCSSSTCAAGASGCGLF
jgi:hypothetical protein